MSEGASGTVNRAQGSRSKGCGFESCCHLSVVLVDIALYLNCLTPPRCEMGELVRMLLIECPCEYAPGMVGQLTYSVSSSNICK